MLFLLNDTVVDIEMPETPLMQKRREMGCSDPAELRAQDAIEFVRDQVAQHLAAGYALQSERIKDLAALIIAKTGAKSLILKPTAGGGLEPRLRDVPVMVLETYQRGADNDGTHKGTGRRSREA